MKKLVIVVAAGMIIVVGVLGYAAYNANSLIARYRPELEKVASNALGRHVSLGDLTVSVFPSTVIQVGELKITEKPESTEAFSLKDLLLRVDLLPLLSGQLVINQLEIIEPQITVVKDTGGIRIEGLPGPTPKDDKSQKDASQTTGEKGTNELASKAPSAPLDFKLDRFLLSNATISFQDRVANRSYDLTNIGVEAGLLLEKDIVNIHELSISATAFNEMTVAIKGEKINYALVNSDLEIGRLAVNTLGNSLEVKGKVNLKSQNGRIELTSPGIKLASFSALKDLIPPAVQALKLSGIVTPNIVADFGPGGNYSANGSIQIEKISLQSGDMNVSDFGGTINLISQANRVQAESNDLALKLNGVPVDLILKGNMLGKKATLEQLQIKGFSGEINADGDYDLQSRQFSVDTKASGINLEQTLKTIKPNQPLKISGTLSRLDAQVTGSLSSDLLQSLRGTIGLLLEDGDLKDVNLAGDVLKSIKGLPFLAAALYTAVPTEHQDELEQDSTAIKRLSGNFNLHNGQLHTSDLKLISTVFSIEADGIIQMVGGIKLNANTIFNKDFSQAMAKKTKEIERILDTEGRLVIPLTLQGTPPKIIIVPNIQKLIEIGASRAVKDAAGRLLDRALGGKNEKGNRLNLPGFGF